MSSGRGVAAGGPAGFGGIDYDLLAAAMLRQSAFHDGLPVGGRGESGAVVSTMLGSRARGGGVVGVGGDAGVECGGEAVTGSEDSFGVIPQSDEVVESGSSAGSVRSSGSVSGGLPGSVGADVRAQIRFGGIVDAYGDGGRPVDGSSLGFFPSTSRRPQTKSLAAAIEGLMRSKVPKKALVELGLCTYTAGTMPDVVKDGAAKLRSLSAIGDAAVTLHVTASAYADGVSVRSAQAARSKLTSDVNMGVIMKKTGLYKFVTYPPGVDPFTSSVTATAFEAIVGVLVLYRSFEDVKSFLSGVGIS